MSTFKVDDVCVLHSLPRHMAHYNGEECSIKEFIAIGHCFSRYGVTFRAKEIGYRVNTRHGDLFVRPSELRKKDSPGKQSADQIWNDLLHRLTEGVPA